MAQANPEQEARGDKATRRVIVELQEIAEERPLWQQLNAYLFDRSGRLLEQQPLTADPKDAGRAEARFDQPLRPGQTVKIGPAVRELAELDRRQPFSQRITLEELRQPLRLRLPRVFWLCWIMVPYVVTGQV